jgi:fatty acid desaturase
MTVANPLLQPSPLPSHFDPDAFKAAIVQAKERATQSVHPEEDRLQFEWFKLTADRFVWTGRLLALACVGLVSVHGMSSWSVAPCILLAAVLTGVGNTARFGIVMHHSAHGGYESVPGHGRARFAMGGALARLRDWTDWILPEAWHFEHNKLHHYRLNEYEGDPDYFQRNISFVTEARWPVPVKAGLLLIMMATWKWNYYAVNTLKELELMRESRTQKGCTQLQLHDVVLNALLHGQWRMMWRAAAVLAPYALTQVVGPVAMAWWCGASPAVLWTMVAYVAASDVTANLHSFCVIVTNHAGEDLYGFTTPCKAGTAEFFARQILGSVSFTGSSDWSDFFHAGLNYQIEHHCFPDLSMLSYRRMQPLIQRVCAEHGVPYVQEPVWKRMQKLYRITVGAAQQPECVTAIAI